MSRTHPRRRLDHGTLAYLHAACGHAAALPFAEAVVVQLADVPRPEGERRERAAAERVVRLLERLEGESDGARAAAERLARDAPLLAAVFQNVDLLYREEYPGAEAVSAAVMGALHILYEPEGAERGP